MHTTGELRSDRIDGLARQIVDHLAATGGRDLEWRTNANCIGVNPDVFFPERGQATDQAKAICAGCQVRVECLTWSLVSGEKVGIWGGVAERTRRALRRQIAVRRAGYARIA